MIELIIILLFGFFLYWLGGVLLPEHQMIQQELIKFEEE